MERLIEQTLARLLATQYVEDGAAHWRGEFPMRLSSQAGSDHNYLSGYALSHLLMALRLGRLPGRAEVETLLDRGRALPLRYQSPAGLGNWYSGRGVSLPAPLSYPWPDGTVVCLRDDYDDTAISALLCALGNFESRGLNVATVFRAAAYDPDRHELADKSQRRLEVVGGNGKGVYQSWALAGPPPPWPRLSGEFPAEVIWLPPRNSLELTTVANIFTAVHIMDPSPSESQGASRAFVNALARFAVERLIEGDASHLDFASSYYPRVPFAPLAYVVRDDVVTSHALLDPDVAALVARAVRQVPPDAGWRQHDFANPAFWLNCCAWCMARGLISRKEIGPRVEEVLTSLRAAAGVEQRWPDVVFFYGAHLGHYSGESYIDAVMVESLSLLRREGFP
jgi:hypothetical protein